MYVCTAAERGWKFHFHFCSSTWTDFIPGCPLAASRRNASHSLCLSFSTFSHILDQDRWKARSILKGNLPFVLRSFSLKQPFFICRLLPNDMSRWTRGRVSLLSTCSKCFFFTGSKMLPSILQCREIFELTFVEKESASLCVFVWLSLDTWMFGRLSHGVLKWQKKTLWKQLLSSLSQAHIQIHAN